MSNKFVVIIPARFGSSRLHGKPLRKIDGREMILRVVDQVRMSNANEVYVATDNEDILDLCKQNGVEALLTSTDLPSGTDRIAAAAKVLSSEGRIDDKELIINVQGDEPLIPPDLINSLAEFSYEGIGAGARFFTASTRISSVEDFHNQNIVKLVKNRNNEAMYFSRSPIPFGREEKDNFPDFCQRHIGIYAYTADFLSSWISSVECELERAEKLEQLRALYSGERILALEIQEAPPHGVDTEEDLMRVEKHIRCNRT